MKRLYLLFMCGFFSGAIYQVCVENWGVMGWVAGFASSITVLYALIKIHQWEGENV